MYQLYNMPAAAALLVTLQAGISCLKSAACDKVHPAHPPPPTTPPSRRTPRGEPALRARAAGPDACAGGGVFGGDGPAEARGGRARASTGCIEREGFATWMS